MFDTSVFASYFCQLFLSRLIHSSGGTKFGIFREHVDYLHFVLLRRGRPDSLLQVALVLITQTKRSTVSIYKLKMYLLLLLNKQLRQLPRTGSLSENRSYHISINKQRFCEQNNCCLPSLCHFTRNKYSTVSLEMK